MLLKEIVQTDIRNIKYRSNFKNMKNSRDMRDSDNSGQFATGRPDPNDPHMYQKSQVYHDETHRDAYPDFIELLLNSDQKDNPCFPRVYTVKKITDKNNESIHKFQLEKLIRFEQIQDNNKILRMLCDKYIDDDNLPDADDMFLFGFIISAIRSACNSNRGNSNIIKDESMIEACNFIADCNKKMKLDGADIHSGNVMLRRTPFGYDIVITDPFGYKNHAS